VGRAVDADLEAQDVRLTMGRRATFVSIDDPDGDEWNTASLCWVPDKRGRLAADLYHRLKDRYAPTVSRILAKASGTRRAATALVIELLLAQGRRAFVGDPQLIGR